MKHNIVFVALLALILSFGYRGADLARLKDDRDTSALSVERGSTDGDRLFLSGKSAGFDPMNIVSGEEPAKKPSQYHDLINIGAAIAASFSRYEPKNAYSSGETQTIVDAFRMSGSGYVYADGYRYFNPAGELRALDCIINPADFRIVYIRFYSPHKTAADPRKAKAALEKFDAIYSEFAEMDAEIDKYLQKAYSSNFLGLSAEDLSRASADYQTVYSNLCRANDFFYDKNAPENKLFQFWIKPVSAAAVKVKAHYGSPSPSGVSYIAFSFVTDELSAAPEYAAYENSILQIARFGKKRLVTFYSIEDDCVEGFYAPPNGGDI